VVDDLNSEIGLDVDAVAEQIDKAVVLLRRGIVTAPEAAHKIQHSTSRFLRLAIASAEDVEIITEYSRAAVLEIAWRRDVMDPVLVEEFEEFLRGQLMVGDVQMQLELLLQPLVAAAVEGDSFALEEIASLCRSGHHTHRLIFCLNTSTQDVLRAAHSVRCAQGLRDAVSPEFRLRGQIAERDRFPQSYELALNLLAHLAADPEEGAAARSALIDLAEHAELAAEAVVRLPMHLLDKDDRARLLNLHECRTELICNDPLFLPLRIEDLRANRVVKGAVWQAFDAAHIR